MGASMDKVKLEKVFGVTKDEILSYIERENVDGSLQTALKTDKQIIVYGSSKQGKTALVNKYIEYAKNIVVRCSPQSTTEDIYKSILRQLDVQILTEVTSKDGSSKSIGVIAKIKTLLPLPGLSAEASMQTSATTTTEDSDKLATIEYNLSLAQDVSELIRKSNPMGKFIIIENFHYLKSEIQERLAFDLRTFQEMGIRFVILGVWREKNRLAQYNGDLLDRIIEVPVEPWDTDDFLRVIHKGEDILNIKFSHTINDSIISNAFDSIGVVQELLKTICSLSGIKESQKRLMMIDSTRVFQEACALKGNDYAARHIRALESIAEGRKPSGHKAEGLYLPYYTVKAILKLDFNDVFRGIRRELLEAVIKKNHHRPGDVRSGDMSNLLHNFVQLQCEKKIEPPILDYNRDSRTLKVVDSTFYFFLRNVNREQIIDELINPLEQ